MTPKVLGWERGPAGHTFVILPGPLEFRMGSPDHEESHSPEETLHYRRIDRSLAVATKEVTVRQYREFDPATCRIRRTATDRRCRR